MKIEDKLAVTYANYNAAKADAEGLLTCVQQLRAKVKRLEQEAIPNDQQSLLYDKGFAAGKEKSEAQNKVLREAIEDALTWVESEYRGKLHDDITGMMVNIRMTSLYQLTLSLKVTE